MTSVDPEPVQGRPSLSFGRILTTKLSAPHLRPSLVARPILLDLITAADAPVTLVCAPAGYGKSTLVTHWLISSGLSPAWVSLDAYDNDPHNFFSLIARAIQALDPEATEHTKALLDGPLAASSHAIVLSILKDLEQTTRAFALVLDDYHVIHEPTIHNAMATLLSNLPPTMRVFLITRSEAPLPLSRLRGRQEILELGPAELRFTDDEALELFQHTNELEVTPGDVGTLNSQAEGWVAGLQLVSHVLRGQPAERVRDFTSGFSGNVRSIEKYLWEEVIDRQPVAVKDFLIRTSILDRFSASLCDAVTGREDSADMVRLVDRERLFVISLDDVGRWYRFHHLFADVLRERMVQLLTEDEITQLHQRAAAWLEHENQIEDAARHAVAGRDWERAGGLLEQVADDLYAMDRDRLTYEWLQGLPEHVLRRNPRLAFYLGFAMMNLGLMPEDLIPIRIAEEAWTVEGNQQNLGLVRIAYSNRSIPLRDSKHVIEHARQALELLPEDHTREVALALTLEGIGHRLEGDCRNAEAAFALSRAKSERIPDSWVRYMEMASSSVLLVQQGKLRDASVLLRRIGTLTDHTYSNSYLLSLLRLGEIYIEWNQLEDAERILRKADLICEQTQTPAWQGWICIALSRALWAQGEVEEAFLQVDRAVAIGNPSSWLSTVPDARAQQARFWLESGQLSLARRWAESCNLDPCLPPHYEKHFEHLTFVRLLIAENQIAPALKILDPVAHAAGEMGRDGDLVEIEVLRSLAYRANGDQPSALASLGRALELGEQGGYVRTFVNEGEAFAPLLRHAAIRGNRREYAKKLLEVFEATETSIISSQGVSSEALSTREVEILRLVAAGLPNKSIGERLYISERTVKKHLSNILSKLGATNRTQAVDLARKINVL